MDITVQAINDGEIEAHKQEILETYRQAFGEPPYNKTEADVISFSQALELRRNRIDARFVAALDGQGQVIGFAYGYAAVEGQWWYDTVARATSAEMQAAWLAGAYELAELAVRPGLQGQRIGSRLHDAILAGLPYARALLSTIDDETTAMQLYRKRGWITLISDFTFPTSLLKYQIMGLRLK